MEFSHKPRLRPNNFFDIREWYLHAFTIAIPTLLADDTDVCLFHKNIYSLNDIELELLSTWLLANKLSLSIGVDRKARGLEGGGWGWGWMWGVWHPSESVEVGILENWLGTFAFPLGRKMSLPWVVVSLAWYSD